MLSVILPLFLLVLVQDVSSFNQQPQIVFPMTRQYVDEDTPINTVVFTVKVFDPENDTVTFRSEGGVFGIDSKTGEVRLIQSVDVDVVLSNGNIEFVIYLNDGQGNNNVRVTILITIRDTNDSPPTFDKTNYAVKLKENSAVGSVLIDQIHVTDLDASNPSLKFSCMRLDKFPTACETFKFIQLAGSSNRQWYGKMVLEKPLDFETMSTYQYALVISDEVHNVVQTIEVIVIDVNDVPPVFLTTSDSSKTINEELLPNTKVLDVDAEDKDTDEKRNIHYDLCQPNEGGYFKVDSSSGNLLMAKRLDREKLTSGQTFQVCIKAREIINPGVPILGNDTKTTATTTVTVTISDINDNTPTFNETSYTVSIPEDIPDQTALPGLQLKITDTDEGTNANFELVITSTDKDIPQTFAVQPSQAQGSASGTIIVIDTTKIDFELRHQQYVLTVEAREITSTPPRLTGTATVTVNILDVNDNKPKFLKDEYTSQVWENAVGGTSVISITASDPDSGTMGSAGIRYSLLGNGADKFEIDSKRGLVTVKACPTPGSGNCIDYEQKKSYSLVVRAEDREGQNFTDKQDSFVPLTIQVLDVNDNSPVFDLDNYEYTVYEGQTVLAPVLPIQAKDVDSVSTVITYSFVTPTTLFKVNPTTGLISATQPVDYEKTPNGQGYYQYTVQASDGQRTVPANVKITVIDQNDNAPRFLQGGNYYAEIREDIQQGTEVVTVSATDVDTGPNGMIAYRMYTGAEDKFSVGSTSGIIRVSQGATFDVDIKDRYILLVRAMDQGDTPRLTATATVTVVVLDANNKDPYFQPPTIQVEVPENKPVGDYVVTMTAKDPDTGANITYSISGTKKQAWDLTGRKVDKASYDYTNVFSIETTTGVVRVSGALNRNKAQVIQYDINAYDNSANPIQTGVGSIIFVITQVNIYPPEFVAPWTLSIPQYNITVRENLAPGSVVKSLLAQDPDGIVTRYVITQDPGGHFNIDPATGVVTTRRPLDYETERSTFFVVKAIDNGQPALTATATIYVTVENVNDHQPLFDKAVYSKTIPENSPAHMSVLQVNANDGDLGTFGVVSYTMPTNNDFYINSTTGVIYVKPGAVLDRETRPEITFTVTAQDSPNHPNQRKSMTMPVYITLSDVNDNSPIFSTKNYSAVIIETIPVDAFILQLDASDKDIGINQKIKYSKVAGDTEGLFRVDPDSGKITTAKTLIDKVGDHFFTVTAADKYGAADGRTDVSYVTVTVKDANNEPPVWIYPNSNNVTINVLENQYLGLEVVQVSARDPDGGRVNYGFMVDGKFSSNHPTQNVEFSMNPITGIISAKQVYDREAKDFYTLLLVARDTGKNQVLTSEIRVLTIRILDTDDHLPEFPLKMSGGTKPYYFTVMENRPPGTFVGKVRATDKDIGKHAVVSYMIDRGDTHERFKVDSNTGEITTTKVLDREVLAQHRLTIKAFNNFTDDSVVTKRKRRATDPNYVEVFIEVLDEPDTVPVFKFENGFDKYYSFLPYDSPLNTVVFILTATDKDKSSELSYQLIKVVERINGTTTTKASVINMFTIDVDKMKNSWLVSNKKDMNYLSSITATDNGQKSATAQSITWITHTYQEMILTVAFSPSDARVYQSTIKDFVSSATNGGLVWIKDIRYHVKDGKVHDDKSDVVLYVADLKEERLLTGIELDDMLEKGMAGNFKIKGELANVIAITGWGSVVGANVDWWPVVWALIAFLVVLILAILLLLLCCCCPCCRTCCYEMEQRSRDRRLAYRRTIAEKDRLRAESSIKNSSVSYYNSGWINKSNMAFSNLAYEHDTGLSEYHRASVLASQAAAASAAYSQSQKMTTFQSTNTVARASTGKEKSANENYTIVSEVLPSADEKVESNQTTIVAPPTLASGGGGQQTTTTTTTKRTSYMSSREPAPIPQPQPQVITLSQPAQPIVNTEYTVVADLPKLQPSIQSTQSQYAIVSQPSTAQYETQTIQRTNTIEAVPLTQPLAPTTNEGYTVVTDLNLPRSVAVPVQTRTQSFVQTSSLPVQQTRTQSFVQTSSVPVQQTQLVDQSRATSFKVVTDLPFTQTQ